MDIASSAKAGLHIFTILFDGLHPSLFHQCPFRTCIEYEQRSCHLEAFSSQVKDTTLAL